MVRAASLRRKARHLRLYPVHRRAVQANQVKQVSISAPGAVTGLLTDGKTFVTQLPTALGGGNLQQDLQAHHVTIVATQAGTSWLGVLLSFAPMILLVGLLLWSGRQATRGIMNGIGAFGQARANETVDGDAVRIVLRDAPAASATLEATR